MAFSENLDQFFDIDSGFAVRAKFKTAAGALIRSAAVHFTDAIDNVGVFDNQAQAPLPFIHCQTADLANVTRDCLVEIDGTDYRIVDDPADGTGTSVLHLQP